MSKVTCEVIGDLLPLYVDDVVSGDTRALVEEHLEGCPACRKLCEDMKAVVTIPLEGDARPLKRFKKAWQRKLLGIVCTTAVLAAAIACCACLMPQTTWNVTAIFVLPLVLGGVVRFFCRELRMGYLVTAAGAVLSLAAFIVSRDPPIHGSELYPLLMVMAMGFTVGSFLVGLAVRIRKK